MELLERERFLETLTSTLGRAATDGGRTVLVSGDAGIGKTALVEHFARANRQRARVLWGGCDALFTPRPLGPLYDIAHQANPDLLKLLEAQAPRPSLFGAFFDDLRGSRGPAIVIFEDVHWADEATLDLIKFLGRRIQQTRTMFIITYRDDEVSTGHPLRSVLGELPSSAVTRLSLVPLTEAAVAALARRAHRPVEGLYAATGGNPFFVTEALASPAEAVPMTVRDAVLARTRRLSPAAREVLDLASVVPGRIERWLLDAALAPVPPAVDECVAAGILRVDESTIAFRHELARLAVEEALPPARLHELHDRVLPTLERDPDAVGLARLVHHASRGANREAVLRWAPAAARQAALLGAHRESAAHYATALRFIGTLPFPPAARAELLERRSYECYLTNQLDAAAEARHAALAIRREAGCREKEGENLRWLSRIIWFMGRRAEAEAYAAEALAVLEACPPGSELAMAYSNRSQLHMLAYEVEDAVAWGRRAIDLARAIGDDETLCHALNNVGTALFNTQLSAQMDEGRDRLEESLRLARDRGYEEHAARALTNLASSALKPRDYVRAARYLEEGIAYCAEHDLDSWGVYMRVWRARMRFEQGRWTEAAEETAALIGTSSPPAITRLHALVVLAQVRVRRGDPETRPLLDEARDLAGRTGELQRIAPVAAARAETAWLQGDLEQCAAEARIGFDLARRLMNPWAMGELGLWLWRCGDPVSPAPDAPEPFRLEMAGNWKAAAAAWERLGCPYEQAMALSNGDEAAQRGALAIFERLGAAPAADLVRNKMRAQGIRGIPRGPRAATRQNPAGLTARELEVLTLVAEGLQNTGIAKRLFVSPKTVDHQISSILAKLNVRTRAEAVAAARKLGILPQHRESSPQT